MGVFDPVILNWKGREYVIPPDGIMGAITRIEDTVTLEELNRYARRATVPLGKLCTAYSDVLRYAGARVSPDEVYAGLFRKGAGADSVVPAITGLLAMMMPPDRGEEADEIPGEHPLGNVRPTAGRASKRRTNSRSAKANG